ncbi:MAG: FAD-dependent oxidoreductase [Desulfotalea sp.]
MAENTTGTVLVAGAGISGIKAAIELAESGYKVLLSDASTQTGGILSKLDYQFPSDHCGMCRMLPMVGREYSSEYCMRKSLHHENIEILPFTEVASISGESGDFQVDLLKKANYVITEACNGLGACLDVCPVEVDDEFNHGLTKRKAIYQPVPHNAPHMLMIDMDSCTECGACVDLCTAGAIDFGAKDETESREVNSIILATGTKLYNIHEAEDAKSYATSPDVVSALAFERMLSSSGSYGGEEIARPSDGKPAKKIAWIQCMGSRNRRQDKPYCSSICCMFALKEAVLAHEKGGDGMDTTIFYMDMRTFGKGFNEYRNKAVQEHGVKLVRCRIQEVVPKINGGLEIRYFDPKTNEFFVKEYDLVVMSTGQTPFEDHKKWANLIGTEPNSLGLIPTEQYSKIKVADKPGIFMCGSLMGLTDISEAMASGMAAAGEATSFLRTISVDRNKEEIIAEPDSDATEVAKVAVVICKCKDNDGLGLDLDLLANNLRNHSGVGAVHINESICTLDGEQAVMKSLTDSGCNRLIIGVCQPYLYRRTVKNLCKKAGFHSSLTKIYDLQSFIRRGARGTAVEAWTNKVSGELKSEVESLKLTPLQPMETMPINQNALVVGGGMAGMYAAISLANKGVGVYLVEREAELGGFIGRTIAKTIDGLAPMETAAELKLKLYEHKNITVHLNSEIGESAGTLGSFESCIVNSETDEKTWIHHGGTIIATGGKEGHTDEYCIEESDQVLTQSEMRDAISTGSIDFSNVEEVVMVQCAGSREEGKRNYCSRICCMWAITNAIQIKKKNPETRVIVLYRDMMTYGFNELYYTEARKEGVLFVSYDLETKPTVEMVDGKPQVSFTESILDAPVVMSADYLVLSTGVDPDESNGRIGYSFGLPIGNDGFFKEVDSKWRPIEFQKLGVFVAGTAHSPQPLKNIIMQAEAAAQKTYSYLQGKELKTARTVSKTKDALCVRCKLCVGVCPYDARSYDPLQERVLVDAAACQGCGMCAVACRNNAAQISGWNDKQLMALVDQKIMDDLSSLMSS